MTAIDVGKILAARISYAQTNTIIVTGAPAAGTYFTFNANGTTYYVWYSVANAGTAPAQPANQLIKVSLTGSESNAVIASLTQSAINSLYFAVPDLRGQFLRGNDPTNTIDVEGNNRFSLFATSLFHLGSYQLDEMYQHSHGIGSNAAATGAAAGGSSGSGLTATYGTFEVRPVNVAG